MFRFIQERRNKQNERTVLDAASTIMWDTLVELYNDEEITAMQLAAWCSSLRRD